MIYTNLILMSSISVMSFSSSVLKKMPNSSFIDDKVNNCILNYIKHICAVIVAKRIGFYSE